MTFLNGQVTVTDTTGVVSHIYHFDEMAMGPVHDHPIVVTYLQWKETSPPQLDKVHVQTLDWNTLCYGIKKDYKNPALRVEFGRYLSEEFFKPIEKRPMHLI